MHTHAYVMARDAEDNLLKLVLSCHPAGLSLGGLTARLWTPRRQAHATSLESFCPGAGIPRGHTFKECILYAKYYVMWEFGIKSHFLYPVVMRIIP